MKGIDMIYSIKQKAFSSKIGSKRIKYKGHDVKFLMFLPYQFDNNIGLLMDIDDINQCIPLTLDEAENLLKDLTAAIEVIKLRNQSA